MRRSFQRYTCIYAPKLNRLTSRAHTLYIIHHIADDFSTVYNDIFGSILRFVDSLVCGRIRPDKSESECVRWGLYRGGGNMTKYIHRRRW